MEDSDERGQRTDMLYATGCPFFEYVVHPYTYTQVQIPQTIYVLTICLLLSYTLSYIHSYTHTHSYPPPPTHTHTYRYEELANWLLGSEGIGAEQLNDVNDLTSRLVISRERLQEHFFGDAH